MIAAGVKRDSNGQPSAGYWCEVCSVSCLSLNTYQTHIAGRKHLKNVLKANGEDGPGNFYCEVCQVRATSKDMLDMHLEGIKHKKKTGQKIPAREPTSGDGPSPKKQKTQPMNCPICHVDINPNGYANHIQKHRIQELMEKKDPSVYCADCDVLFTSLSVKQSHEAGTKHMHKVNAKNPCVSFNILPDSLPAVIARRTTAKACQLCDLKFAKPHDAVLHYQSKDHVRILRMELNKVDPKILADVDGQFICDVCEFTAPTREVIDGHLQGFKHYLKANQGNLDMDGPFKEKLKRRSDGLAAMKEKTKEKKKLKQEANSK